MTKIARSVEVTEARRPRPNRPPAAPAALEKPHPVPPLPPLWKEAALVMGASWLTVAALLWIFPPSGIWPLAFVCLTPWTVALCAARRAWLVHWGSFIAGFLFFLIGLRWLYPVTELGFVALAVYLAFYWPLAGWAIRTGRRHGISPVWTLPVAWVACEYLRAWVMSGFPWLFLAHGLYEQLHLIQISDLAGAYAVTFLLAMLNGLAAEAVLALMRSTAFTGRRQFTMGAIVTLGLFLGAIGYGFFQLHRSTLKPGPTIAVLQEDFPDSSDPRLLSDPRLIFVRYMQQAVAAAERKPDLIAFPETAWGGFQDAAFVTLEPVKLDSDDRSRWDLGRVYAGITAALARGDLPAANEQLALLERTPPSWRRTRLPRFPENSIPAVPFVVGSLALEYTPQDEFAKKRTYNSAILYGGDGVQLAQRYDKRHLVPFGELVPFRGTRLHWLYRWLNNLSPFSYDGKIEYSLTPGASGQLFPLRTGQRDYNFGTPICYEDVMPYVVRDLVWSKGAKRADFLVSMSNDGWFRPPDALVQGAGSGWSGWLQRALLCPNELPQHLAICAFRAIENRVGIARAVNTGYSGFINSNGEIYSMIQKNGRQMGVAGYSVAQIMLDDRRSLYGIAGDWFAGLCLILTCLLWANAVSARWIASARAHVAAMRARWRTQA